MSTSKKRLVITGGLAATALSAAVLLPVSGAFAGHENAVLETTLDGRSEVGESPRVAGDTDGRGEAYVFGIDGDTSTLCYVLTVDKIDLAAAAANGAHIHEGQPGENGPVVARLAFPVGGNAADCLTEGENDATGPKFPAQPDAGVVQEILSNPGDYYVNVHNGAFPQGAIRGQLAPQS